MKMMLKGRVIDRFKSGPEKGNKEYAKMVVEGEGGRADVVTISTKTRLDLGEQEIAVDMRLPDFVDGLK
jgi:hypothetical protein